MNIFGDSASWLRTQPSLTGTAPALDVHSLPDDPVTLFRLWISEAAALGVPEPHAVALATVDADGMPDARTLILKDVDERGWAFAGQRSSRKGAQLAARPVAALDFWWQAVVRSVRLRGAVYEATAEDSAADLAARSAAARAEVGHDDWVLWRLVPTRVEFWQGAVDRRHLRIIYHDEGMGWERMVSGGES